MDITEEKLDLTKHPAGHGIWLFSAVTVSVIIGVFVIYFALLPKATYSSLIEGARTYAGLFSSANGFSDALSAVNKLLSDELILFLWMLLCPSFVFYKSAVYITLLSRSLFISLGISAVQASGAGLLPFISVSFAGAASVAALVYSSHAALRFGESVYEGRRIRLRELIKYTLKLLSAFGCNVAVHFLTVLAGMLY